MMRAELDDQGVHRGSWNEIWIERELASAGGRVRPLWVRRRFAVGVPGLSPTVCAYRVRCRRLPLNSAGALH